MQQLQIKNDGDVVRRIEEQQRQEELRKQEIEQKRIRKAKE